MFVSFSARLIPLGFWWYLELPTAIACGISPASDGTATLLAVR
jgi:hypothetical protein